MVAFEVLRWWEEERPDAMYNELSEWWVYNRGTRTDEEFARLLGQIIRQDNLMDNDSSAELNQLLASTTLQQSVERTLFKRSAVA